MHFEEEKVSPMMAQWMACKKEAPDAILLFRLGDFYEAFYEDAVMLACELDLTLTKRQDVPMAGVPFHAAESYIDKLVAKGKRVAIAEQMEDARSVKGLVKREIVRVVTPGTLITSSLLKDKANNFLACTTELNGVFGLSVLDVTTADFKAMECEGEKQLIDALCRLSPKELLLPEGWKKQHSDLIEEIKGYLPLSVHFKQAWHFDHQHACETLLRHFRVRSLDGFGLQGMACAINAAGAVLHYVQEDLGLSIAHIKEVRTERLSRYMLLDRATQKNLELFDPLHEEAHTLFSFLERTETPMGARLLKQWLLHPLMDVSQIQMRQEGVAELLAQAEVRDAILPHLRQVRDLERLMMRIETGYASPRDVAGLRFSLEHIAPLERLLHTAQSAILQSARQDLADVSTLVKKIADALVDHPPLRVSEGEIFKRDFHPQLDELHVLKKDSHSYLAAYQVELREKTQIKTLKVGYTKAFGYYIEISRGQAERIPDYFQRRQTLVNAERCITPELKEYEYKMLHAEERMAALEHELFAALRAEVISYAEQVRAIAKAVAHIDCLLCLATLAQRYRYTRPLVDASDRLLIEEGRHPVIEAMLQAEPFIPNDVLLDETSNRLLLITGPNMAGKSTFIRQVALIAILAQMGSFVPAKRAHIGVIDRVFSRIGASDDLSRGQSTFMVEMAETANILNYATKRSLVILDEIGRGTSTYDGISIAWAVAEYLLTEPQKRAMTLFATHYWELTEMENKIPGAVNFNVAVQESEKGIIFLHKIVKGGTDKSYGIHVACLAGLPHAVIKRAKEMLATLEKNGRSPAVIKRSGEKQLSLFSTP
ncbi:MAG TPA: DNA mismatch repair protein MutS [Rhabdochlamydiaceae bacterium]|jgi:DNA mismatch repair protein MutS